MTTSTRIATGLSAVAVAGILVLGLALMFGPRGKPAVVATSASSTPRGSVAESAESASPETPSSGLPDGYVNVGEGTWIPGGGPGDCEASAYIWIGSGNGGPERAEMHGADLVDMGPREFATGEVELDEHGRPLSYTVAPGDVLNVIGDRFCIYNGLMLSQLNNYSPSAQIQPGDVLILDADYAGEVVSPSAPE